MPGISAVGTLARYFSLRFFIAMLAMFLICCILIFFVDFIEMLRRAGNYSGDVPGLLLAWMTLLRLPSFSELTLPFAVLIGSIGIFLMLSRSSELVVLRAAGISVWQFTLPAMIVAFLIGIGFVLVYNPLAAVARGEAERLYARHALYFYNRCLHLYSGFANPPGYTSEATIRQGMEGQIKLAADRNKELQDLTWSQVLDRGYVVAGTPDSVVQQLDRQTVAHPPSLR
jgi:hypothetical protein